ncbi:MAG: LysE family transporter [Alphaproteobacteria bacterium]|nr:MAG: LysE family transporter [Alphaproteobacteria bacterium]
MSIFFQAILIGLAIAMPLDEIYLLCIKRSIDHDMRPSVLIGLGAACADCLFVMLSQMPFFQSIFITHAALIQILAGIFLIGLGVNEVRHVLKYKNKGTCPVDNRALWFYAFCMEMTNPVTIAIILSFYKSIHVVTIFEGLQIVLGVFLSVILWWTFVGFLINYYRRFLSQKFLYFIKLITSIALIIIGIIVTKIA